MENYTLLGKRRGGMRIASREKLCIFSAERRWGANRFAWMIVKYILKQEIFVQ